VERRKKTVALSSVGASFLLTIIKLVVGILTGSIGIISEAAHSGLDLAAAFITYLTVRISGNPADFTHHYGYGKAESISALIETALLLLTSAFIIYESIHRLIFGGTEIQVTWYAFVIMIFSMIVDYSRSKILYKVAKETKSQALEADALHFHSDIYSSGVVVVGLICVLLGIRGADSFAGIGVALLIILMSVKLGKRTIDVLMDVAPKGLTEEVGNIINNVNGVIKIGRLRVRPAGDAIFIDTIVKVERKASLEKVHEITKDIEDDVKKAFPGADMVIHVEPIASENETLAERVQIIARNYGVGAHDIFLHATGGKKFINFHLEVDEKRSFEEAHKTSTALEKAIKNEFGKNVVVNTHIEPQKSFEIASNKISPREMLEINKVCDEAKKILNSIKDIHNITVHQTNGKLCISLHCLFNKKLSIEQVHEQSTKIENFLKEKLPNIDQVFVHPEPFKK